MIRTFDDLWNEVKKSIDKPIIAVAGAHDEEVIKACSQAMKSQLADFIFVGEADKIINLLNCEGVQHKNNIVQESDLIKIAEKAVRFVSDGHANFLMKGMIDTSILLKEVLNKDYGLRESSHLSHVMVYQIPKYHKLLLLTDAGMTILPTLEQKVLIINNAIKVAKALGKDPVKVGVLAAKEKVDLNMIATVHGEELVEMWKNGSFGTNVILGGPMALDIAISKKAANIKKYFDDVAGDADVVLVPNIEAGNGIGKAISYFADGASAGVIMGAKVPIILVSRADDHQTKLNSIALGCLISNINRG